ncbi:hypothetical protein LJC49_04595 [Ruminococcaceae bacterium OttesenSCG-928-I18]|nr:hypothetical protein [Ruminococcaceae bacterium OttesenSCG-928-I18]
MVKTILTPLSEEERKFAEEHHDIVLEFLHQKRRRFDEYYDVVIFGYLKAVKLWFSKSEIQRHTFNAIAMKRMFGELQHHARDSKRPIRQAPDTVLSLDMEMTESGIGFYDLLPDPDNFVKRVEQQEVIAKCLSRVPKKTAALLIDYYSSSPKQRVRNIKDKWHEGEENPIIECGCGCGTKMQMFNPKTRVKRFYLPGHNKPEPVFQKPHIDLSLFIDLRDEIAQVI